MWLLNKSQTKVSSRSQIAIKEVRDGVLSLPDNQYCMIVETSAINFELKSEDEQDVIIDSFQTFLNSLPNKLQILIRVRELDIDQYLEQIKNLKKREDNQIYQSQIDSYSIFIKKLVSGNKILSRRFFIIIPYQLEKSSDFNLAKQQLKLTKNLVMKQLEKIGIKARSLNSLEVLNLFYSFYNQDQIKTQELNAQTIQKLIQHHHA